MYTFNSIAESYKSSFNKYKRGVDLARFFFKEKDFKWLSEGNNEFLNGCTIRLSYAFNLSGLRIPKGIGTVSGRLKEKEILKLEYYYYYRARDLKNFLLKKFRNPFINANNITNHFEQEKYISRIKGKSGIIALIFRNGVSGHVDVVENGNLIGNNTVFHNNIKEFYFWEYFKIMGA